MNPIQMMFSMFQGHPMLGRAQQMSQGKGVDQIEEICRNVCKQRGFDFDQMKDQFNAQCRNMQNMRK